MTTTVIVASGRVSYKADGMKGEAVALDEGRSVAFRSIPGAPRAATRHADDKNWLERLMLWLRSQAVPRDVSAPCFGSASTPGHAVAGAIEITTNEPVVVRTYGKAGSFDDDVMTPADSPLTLDMIEENAVTVALYGVEPV